MADARDPSAIINETDRANATNQASGGSTSGLTDAQRVENARLAELYKVNPQAGELSQPGNLAKALGVTSFSVAGGMTPEKFAILQQAGISRIIAGQQENKTGLSISQLKNIQSEFSNMRSNNIFQSQQNILSANRLLPSINLKLEGKLPLTSGETYLSLFDAKQTLEGAISSESEYSGVDASFGYDTNQYSGLEAFGAYYQRKQAQVTPELAFAYSSGKVQMNGVSVDVSNEYQSKYTMPSFEDLRQRAISLDVEAITGTQNADRGYFITPKEGGGSVGLLSGSKSSYFNIFERGVKDANRTGLPTYIGGMGITYSPTIMNYGEGIINETSREAKARGYTAEEGRQFEMVKTFGRGEHPITLNMQYSVFGRTRGGMLGVEGRPPLLTQMQTGYIISTKSNVIPFMGTTGRMTAGGYPEPPTITQEVYFPPTVFGSGGMAIYEKSKTEAWNYAVEQANNRAASEAASSYEQPTAIQSRVTEMGAFVEGLPGISFLHERASISQAYAAKHEGDIFGNFMRELGQGVLLYPESTAKLLIATGGIYATAISGDKITYGRGRKSVGEAYSQVDYPKLFLTSAIFAGLGVRRATTPKPFEIEASVVKGSIEVEQGVMRAKYDVALKDVMQPNKATAGSGFVALKGDSTASSVFHPMEFTKGKLFGLFGKEKVGFNPGKSQFSISSIVESKPRVVGIAFKEGKNIAYKVAKVDESLVQRQSLGGVVGKKGSTETYVRDIFRKDIMQGNRKIGEEYTSLVAVKQGRGYRQGIMRTRFPFDEKANLVGGQGGSFQKYVQVMKLAKQTKLVQETIFKSVTSQIEVPSEGGAMTRIGAITLPITTTKAVNVMRPITTTKPVTTTRAFTVMRPVTSMRSVTTTRPITSIRSITSFRPITSFRSITSMRPITSMRSVASTRPITSLRSVTTTRPITTVRPITSLRSVTSLRPVTTFRIPNPPPPVIIPGGILPFPIEKARRKGKKGKRGKRKFGYEPSLTAGIFNIRGRVSSSILSGKQQISGLELRPLVRGGRKTRFKMGRFR